MLDRIHIRRLLLATVVLLAPVGKVFAQSASSQLWVSDLRGHSLKRFDGSTGAYVDAVGAGHLNFPTYMTAGPDGNVYVNDCGAPGESGIRRFNGVTGAFIDTFVSGPATCYGVAFGPDGNLYVAILYYDGQTPNGIARYNGSTGAYIDDFVPEGTGGLIQAQGFVFGPDGNLYVANNNAHNILRYNGTTGAFLGVFADGGTDGTGGFNALTFGPDGDLYAAALYSHGVRRYDGQTGAELGYFVPPGEGGLSWPDDIAFGPDGNLYVLQRYSGSVLRYDGHTGAPLGTFTSGNLSGEVFGLVWFPAVDGPVGNTTVGSGVAVDVPTTLPNGSPSGVSLTFDNVTTAGETEVTTSAAGPPPPTGFKLTSPPVYYEITTTATFAGNIRVCLHWSEGQVANENNVRLFHREGSAWVDITDASSRNTVTNTVCGTATSLSPFTLFEVKYPFTGFFAPIENGSTNAVKAGAAVPVKFSLGGNLGLNIFASGYPRAQLMQCNSGDLIDVITETVNAGSSSLSYDSTTGRYTYVWKTEKSWANTCRELQVKLTDGETYTARFTFR